jgi:hypothetical protein
MPEDESAVACISEPDRAIAGTFIASVRFRDFDFTRALVKQQRRVNGRHSDYSAFSSQSAHFRKSAAMMANASKYIVTHIKVVRRRLPAK